MTPKEVANLIDSKLDDLIPQLMVRFGNEGSDIGDSSSVYELLGNTMPEWNDDHSSYTIPEFLGAIAEITNIPLDDITGLYRELKTWNQKQWADAGAWKGFI